MFDSFLKEYGVKAEEPVNVPQYTYVIVEPLFEEDLMKVVYQNGVADLRHAKLFADTEYRDIADKGPIIVQLSSKNDSFAVLKQRFEEKPSGCFIQSTQPFESVVTWARQRLTAQTGQASALLRYYEPRMLLPLLGGLSQEEKTSFISTIGSIRWFHRAWLALDTTTATSLLPLEQDQSSNKPEQIADYSGLVLSSEHLSKMASIQQQWAEQGK
ncbi:uncharacterized protein DUF4123 [Marinomonas alcarazii]|uniref:Uncharacterized protein DUF4123 n=1 Tax=Marinomonas alcarazii TaxID=491949 RepID=A0A318UPB2_9GAMM|nr:DUF4123 domain-containing protein [Marinomonas alcarazii]PYF77793.1 uncharacterized protein DUF4123 [Marinomonas alcarazii]